MTDFNPFSAADEVPAAAPVVEEEGGSNGKLLIGLGALAAVAVGAGAFLLLGGSADDAEDFGLVQAAPRAAAPAASPVAAPQAKLPAQANLTLGRNPFRALYVEPVAAPEAPASGTTPTGTTAVGVTPVVVAPATGSGTPACVCAPGSGAGQPAPTTNQPAPAPARQSTLRLLSVETGKGGANPMALFDYDGKEVTGGEGDVMAGKLLVLSLQQDHTGSWFANLQLGDGSPFEVHERQTVVVQ